MKLKAWQWLIGAVVLVALILVGVAIGRHWRSNNAINQTNINQHSVQSPQNTQVPTSPPPVELQ